MSGILPPDVAYKASRAQSQAIAEYLGAGGSADDTSTEGIPLLHLVLSASRRYGLVIGDRLEGAVRAVLDGGPRDVDVRWRGRTPLHIAVGSCLTSTQVLSSFLPKQLNIIAMLVEAGADVNGRCGPRDATDVFFSRAALDAHARPPPAPKSRRVPLHGASRGRVPARDRVLEERPRRLL